MRVCKLKRFFGSLLVVVFVSCMLTGCAGNSAGKVNETEEWISELEDRAVEITDTEQKKE